MPIVGAFVDSPGIVENGEQLNDFDVGPGFLGQPQPVLQHPGPMANAVRAMPGQGVVFENGVDEGFEVEHGILTWP